MRVTVATGSRSRHDARWRCTPQWRGTPHWRGDRGGSAGCVLAPEGGSWATTGHQSRQTVADEAMTRTTMFGPPVTFLGVPEADLDAPSSLAGAGAVVVGAPFDGGTSHRAGCRFGPSAMRMADYLPHDGRRPHLALGVDPLVDLAVVDVGDVEMPPGDMEASLARLESAVGTVAATGAIPVILGGDHTIALPDVTGVARVVGWGEVSVIHFDAHADTGDTQFGSLYGHGTPMRRLIESGAVRADRFLQIGLRGYWPPPDILGWMAQGGMRSYEMSEVGARPLPHRGLRDRHRRLPRGVPLGGCRRRRPGGRTRDRHPRAGRADQPPAARRGPPLCHGAADRRCGRGGGLAPL